MLNKVIKYFLENRIITAFLLVGVLFGGLATAPFNWHGGLIPRNPISVDAIPDIGDNQQIVATEWMGPAGAAYHSRLLRALWTVGSRWCVGGGFRGWLCERIPGRPRS